MNLPKSTTAREVLSRYDAFLIDAFGVLVRGDGLLPGAIDFVKALNEEVPVSECWEKTGKGPIGARWVDILKGELTRSRLVA